MAESLEDNRAEVESLRREEVGIWTQTFILLGKNWKQKIRTEGKKLFFEIFLPILYLSFLGFIVSFVKENTFPEVTEEYGAPQDVLHSLEITPATVHIVHSNTTVAGNIVDLMKEIWTDSGRPRPVDSVLTFKLVKSEKELLKEYAISDDVRFAVILSEKNSFEYSIRLSPDNTTVDTVPKPSAKRQGPETCRALTNKQPFLEPPPTCPVNGYFYSNFLAVQHLVDNALIKREAKLQGITNISNPFVTTVGNYPKHNYTTGMPPVLRIMIPIYCILPMAQLINTLLILVVTEKESRIKDGLTMIGVSEVAYWMSWFILYGVIVIFFGIVFTLILHFTNVLRNLSVVILFLLFTLFGFSVITFAFALTPFFHKPKTAGAVGTMIMQFAGMLFMLQTFLVGQDSAILMPLRLISSVAFATALDTATEYEQSGGISLSEVGPGSKGASIFYAFVFLVFDTALYGLLAIYLDNVMPNEYGVRKEPFYFLRPSFWRKPKIKRLSNEELEEIKEIESDDVEKVEGSLIGKEAFRLRNVEKTFTSMFHKGKGVEAVKDLSLDIYQDQITALLGRNGAGKTTLVNMMIGLLTPTSGRCIVFGLDIAKPANMLRLRKEIGVCLQSDLHFSALTVQEHLEFYGRLRGVPRAELWLEIREIVKELNLESQIYGRAENLSGGQKRKLSVGMALIGSPKVVLLDEPSSGVDPVSRRKLWAFLQKRKTGRTIILTTHFLDEADILADRKAMIHNGSLKCVGSSIFLKKRFGVGYQLTVELDETRVSKAEDCDAIVERWIPSAMSSRRLIAHEVKYSLPNSEVSKFSSLFEDFESAIKAESVILSFGVSMTTLSEVFAKISSDMDMTFSDPKMVESLPHRRMSATSAENVDPSAISQQPLDPAGSVDNLIPDIGDYSFNSCAIFYSLCHLRALRLLRNLQAFFFMVILPVIFIAVGFFLVKIQGSVNQDESVLFDTNFSDVYPENEVPIAYTEQSTPSFPKFLNQTRNKLFPYTGNYSELLSIGGQSGTMMAFDVDAANSTVNVRVNETYTHSLPMAVNALNQFFLESALTTNQTISTSHEPLPSKNANILPQGAYISMFLVGPAFTLTPLGMVMELVTDREKKTRNHLRVNGVSFMMYFSSIFFVYGMLYFAVTISEIIVIVAFSVPAFTNPSLTVMIFLSTLFILPSLLFSAAFSYFFNRLDTATPWFSQVAYLSTYISAFAAIFIDMLAPDYFLLFHTISSFLNVFYIPIGILYNIEKKYLTCSIFNTCDQLTLEDYTETRFWTMGLAMVVQIPVFLVLLMVADNLKYGGRLVSMLGYIVGKGPAVVRNNPSGRSDDDVKTEAIRVKEYFDDPQSNTQCVVAVQDLCKSYTVKQKGAQYDVPVIVSKKALQGIDLMVEEGEVFGLLGHNGAGKTTCLKLLIAEETPNSGKIRLCGMDISSSLSEAFHKLGYCPQHDALWENITLREHLELYATIRGVKPSIRDKLVKHYMNGLQIAEHANKKAKTLSGGTKRKLSYCMSILGAPKIVLLDEPSTGMDIISKRFLWNTIIATFTHERGAILTTHSMEEADALCGRIAIMNKGALVCIGSPQHLKSKFGVGYNLEIKLKHDETGEGTNRTCNSTMPISISTASLKLKFSFIHTYFPEATVSEMIENRAVFAIPKESISSVAQTFALLEKIKVDHYVEDYSFSQTTLEQIFLQFATDDGDEDTPP